MRKPSTTIRISNEARELLQSLAKQLGISQAAVMEIAIRKLHKEENKTMNTQTKTIKISSGTFTVDQLAALVAAASQRGEWYDGPNSTHIGDWIEEGDYTGDETIESLAAEWDK